MCFLNGLSANNHYLSYDFNIAHSYNVKDKIDSRVNNNITLNASFEFY